VDFSLLVSQLTIGIGNGVVYASLALALVIIFMTTGILNFAQGEFALFSSYVTWWLAVDRGLPVWLALLISIGVSFVFGMAIERVVIRPFEGGSPLVIVIVTLGLFLAVNSIVQLIFGTDSKQMPRAYPDHRWHLGVLNLSADTVALVLALVVECLLLYFLFQRTKVGVAMRGVASNPDSSRLLGVNVGTMLMLGWGLATALGALAGSMVVPTTPALTAGSMQSILVYSFAAAALGGFDSPVGAVVGGLIVGVLNALAIQYVSFLKDIELVLPFTIILVVLMVRPNGLFGRQRVERV
jgi:branched-chain amino acid transport system permease protein